MYRRKWLWKRFLVPLRFACCLRFLLEHLFGEYGLCWYVWMRGWQAIRLEWLYPRIQRDGCECPFRLFLAWWSDRRRKIQDDYGRCGSVQVFTRRKRSSYQGGLWKSRSASDGYGNYSVFSIFGFQYECRLYLYVALAVQRLRYSRTVRCKDGYE